MNLKHPVRRQCLLASFFRHSLSKYRMLDLFLDFLVLPRHITATSVIFELFWTKEKAPQGVL
ncbi:terminase small subunit [Aeribacillus phage AP45]|uniref:Terminase small subunit n=1 Tax=Aeribacillus phage AP45 TaxID=1913112 RepID=A0A1L2JY42_9CAUD|nr:terminase small subunit [Aeribacillus phage AP45]APC46486.1 terminase small subunit [Aeribacillus phage AP45]